MEWANLHSDGQLLSIGVARFQEDRQAGVWMPSGARRMDFDPSLQTNLKLICASGELLLASIRREPTQIEAYTFEVARQS